MPTRDDGSNTESNRRAELAHEINEAIRTRALVGASLTLSDQINTPLDVLRTMAGMASLIRGLRQETDRLYKINRERPWGGDDLAKYASVNSSRAATGLPSLTVQQAPIGALDALLDMAGALDYQRRRADDAEALHASAEGALTHERARARSLRAQLTDDETAVNAVTPVTSAPAEPAPARGDVATIAARIASLVVEKDAAYGRAFDKAAAFFAVLYPDGMKPDQYADALGLVRVFDKMQRIATDRDALGESPWQDIAGYALLALRRMAETPKPATVHLGPDAPGELIQFRVPPGVDAHELYKSLLVSFEDSIKAYALRIASGQ